MILVIVDEVNLVAFQTSFHRSQTIDMERTRIRKNVSLPSLSPFGKNPHALSRTNQAKPSQATPLPDERATLVEEKGSRRREGEQKGELRSVVADLKKKRRSLQILT